MTFSESLFTQSQRFGTNVTLIDLSVNTHVHAHLYFKWKQKQQGIYHLKQMPRWLAKMWWHPKFSTV